MTSGYFKAKMATFLIDHILQPEFGNRTQTSPKMKIDLEKTASVNVNSHQNYPDYKPVNNEQTMSKETVLTSLQDPSSLNVDNNFKSAMKSGNLIVRHQKSVEALGNLDMQPINALAKMSKEPLKEKRGPKNVLENEQKSVSNSPVSTKFPAWIYCTRYSDRPSCSGKKYFDFFTVISYATAVLVVAVAVAVLVLVVQQFISTENNSIYIGINLKNNHQMEPDWLAGLALSKQD